MVMSHEVDTALSGSKSDPEALQGAGGWRDEVISRIKNLHPAAVLAYALKRAPDGASDAEAMRWFSAELEYELGVFDGFHAEVEAALADERARLIPLVDAATRRHMALEFRIGQIDSTIAVYKRPDDKRERLLKAGASNEEVDRIAAPRDCSGLLAERDELSAENDALVLFFRTKNERHLPQGFHGKVDEYRTQNGANVIPRAA